MYLVALYSVGAVILLSYLSFKWVYSHPSQVAIRIEKAAQEAGVFSVKVLGATQESLAGMRADELAIDAGEASLASLTGVHVGDVEVHCTCGHSCASAGVFGDLASSAVRRPRLCPCYIVAN